MSVYTYKCPNCSASLYYNPKKDKLNCDFCKSEFTREEIDKYLKDNPDKIIITKSDLDKKTDNEKKEEQIRGYNCENCAAEVVTDSTTLTTFCYFCHSPVVIVDKANNEFRPDMVIPFKFSREDAIKKFLEWVDKKIYVPKSFYSDSQLEKITGIYLPYWCVDVNMDLDFNAEGIITSSKESGNNILKKERKYDITKKGEFTINGITELAYKKVNRALLFSILPYDLNEAVPFKIFYLNGFFSETYELTKDDIEKKIDEHIKRYHHALVQNILVQYENRSVIHDEAKVVNKEWKYILLPTFLMTYDYKNKKYIYAMNAQTGMFYGDLPIDLRKVRRDALFIAIVMFIAVLIGGYFIS